MAGNDTEHTLTVQFKDEGHTLANALTHQLNLSPDVMFAGACPCQIYYWTVMFLVGAQAK